MASRTKSFVNIANRTVLITEANRGLGRALVDEALKRGGKKVYAAARRPLPVADDRVRLLSLDVTDLSQIRRAAEHVDSLDVLINSAGAAICDAFSS